MKLTKAQMETYSESGMILIPECFNETEIARMQAALLDLIKEDTPGRVLERDRKTVRALHGCHTTSQVFHRLTLHPRLLEPAKQILASETYVYQFKINLKAAFTGDAWPWHQDFVFWNKEDGMRSPLVVNAAVFLDEVNEFNGPIYFILGSHKENHTHVEAANAKNPEWTENFSADLKYTLPRSTIALLAEKQNIVAPKGAPGTVLLFHCNIVHGSVPNISPYDRKLALITYNSLENIPVSKGEPRPEFLVSRDYTPLKPLDDGILL